MKPIFEAKYIDIKWYDKSTAISIEESNDIIPITIVNNSTCIIENVITYSKFKQDKNKRHKYGQIAFHLPDDSKKNIIPSFKINEFEYSELISVIDNVTGKKWWIEGRKWSSSEKTWRSEIFRSAGEVVLKIGMVECTIHISSSSFTYEELELYLQDFRNDFSSLILNESSHIKGKAKSKEKNPTIKNLDNSSTELISKLIDFLTGILQNPKKELREIQSLQNYKKVRPVPRTFMEIASKGMQRLLTSRGYSDSYNIAENKYIYFLVCKICVFVQNFRTISSYTSTIQENKIEDYKERLESLKDYKIRDKEVFDYEISELKKTVANEKNKIEDAIIKYKKRGGAKNVKNILKHKTIYLELQGKTFYDNNLQFNSKIKTQSSNTWHKFENNDFCKVCFDNNIFDHILKSYYQYKIVGSYEYENQPYYNKNEKYKVKENIKGHIHKIKFENIESIEIIKSKALEKLNIHLIERNKLEKNDWKRQLTNKERDEQNREKKSIGESIKFTDDCRKKNFSLSKKLAPLLSKMINIKKQFERLNVQADGYFPNSMTFIQNPNYQGSHKLYKEIIKLSGLDENLFVKLQEVEKIGILNISLIYERWCLLQIIKILIEVYRFVPEENWKSKLIKLTLESDKKKGQTEKNISIQFENIDTQRKITLWYEKGININDKIKVPDFILDVQSTFGREADVHRFIMDAKFHENINEKKFGGISTVIDHMYNQSEENMEKNKKKLYRNYSKDKKNTVYILHPSKNSVPQKKTPQKWAKNSYYGELSMFDWDNNLPNHKYGGILLSPIRRSGNYLDDLQRLIGMFLQYGIEDNNKIQDNNGKYDPIVREKIFCLVCGSDKYYGNTKETKNGIKYWITCCDCYHFTIYNYCAKCKNRLIKNGDYWTYHSTQVLDTTNIKCPACGNFF
jgi:pyrethroid hydrolase